MIFFKLLVEVRSLLLSYPILSFSLLYIQEKRLYNVHGTPFALPRVISLFHDARDREIVKRTGKPSDPRRHG